MADKKISALPVATTVNYNDKFVIVQGTTTKQCEGSQIKDSFMQVFGQYVLTGTTTFTFSQALGTGVSSYEVMTELTDQDGNAYYNYTITKIDENSCSVTVDDDNVFIKLIAYLRS